MIFQTDLGNVQKNERMFQEKTKFCFALSEAISLYKPQKSHLDSLIAKRLEYIQKKNPELVQKSEEENDKIKNIETNKNESPNNNLSLSSNTNSFNDNLNSGNKKKNKRNLNEITSNITKNTSENLNSHVNTKRKKAYWEDEGILGFTNSRCTGFKPKTIFFK